MPSRKKKQLVAVGNDVEDPVEIDDSDSDEDGLDLGHPNAPDGGWGWFVVVAAFLSRLVVDGVASGYTDLLQAATTNLGGREEDIPNIIAVASVFYCVAGPISGLLINTFSCRVVTILGGSVGTLGLILTKFAPSIGFLFFSVGVLVGFGSGCINITSIVVVSRYFRTCRAIMTGLTVSGSGLGGLTIQPLTSSLIVRYGWDWTALILAAIYLTSAVCGLTYRDLSMYSSQDENQTENEMKTRSEKKIPVDDNTGKENRDDGSSAKESESKNVLQKGRHAIAKKFQRQRNMAITEEKGDVKAFDRLDGPSTSTSRSTADNMGGPKDDDDIVEDTTGEPSEKRKTENTTLALLFTRFAGVFKRKRPKTSDQDDVKGSIEEGVEEDQQQEREELIQGETSRTVTGADEKGGLIRYQLFTDPWFIAFNVSVFFSSFGYIVPFMYVDELAIEAGFEEGTAAWTVSSVSISSVIGRLVFGVLADKLCFNAQRIFGVAMVAAGFVTVFGPLCNSMDLPFFTASTYGLFSGATSALTSIILIELIGLTPLPDSLGWLTLFSGVPSIISPYFARWITTETGRHIGAFIVAGISIIFSGIIILIIEYVRKVRGIKNNRINNHCCASCAFCCHT